MTAAIAPICADCARAEREPWPVYAVTAWCCRARHIVDASVPLRRQGLSLADVRRRLAEAERAAHPDDWPLVRARLAVLAGRDAA